MTTTDLGKWMITNGGNYDPEATYEQLTMVMYENSTYITLRTVTGITPSNDNQNYILMAQGFDSTALSSIQAEDTSGLLGEPGENVSAQSLIDYLADAVATKLLKKTDIATSIENSNSSVPASSLLYELNSDISKVLIRGSNFTAVQSPSNNGCRIQINDSGDITKGDLTDGTVTKWENILTNADIQTEYNVANSNVVFRCEATDGSAIQLATTATQLQLQKRTSATGSWEVVWEK